MSENSFCKSYVVASRSLVRYILCANYEYSDRLLGAGWEVIASVGHVRDLPTKEMAVDLQTFEPTFIDSLGGGNFVKWNLEDRCSHFNPGYNLWGLRPCDCLRSVAPHESLYVCSTPNIVAVSLAVHS